MNHKFFLLIIIMIAGVGCGSDEAATSAAPTLVQTDDPMPVPDISPTAVLSCLEQSADFIGDIEAMFERWDDAVALASSTPRTDLSSPIATLQELKREAGALIAPDCASKVKTAFVEYMELTIDRLISFLADPEETIGTGLNDAIADSSLDYFLFSLLALKANEVGQDHIVIYIVNSAGITRNIRYIDETGAAIEGFQRVPWNYSFTADPGTMLMVEVSASPPPTLKMACAIVVDGRVIAATYRPTDNVALCQAIAR